jgi:hypothetical protein
MTEPSLLCGRNGSGSPSTSSGMLGTADLRVEGRSAKRVVQKKAAPKAAS